MRPLTLALLTLLLLIVLAACAPKALDRPTAPWPGLAAGAHAVGFRTLHVFDHSRSFPSDPTDPVSAPGSRPVQIALWYPARLGWGAHPLSNWEYVALSRSALDFARAEGGDADVVVGAAREHAKRRGNDPEATAALLESRAGVWRDANPAEGRHPLLVYSAGFESVSWENTALAEYLASHGFVVAATHSIGARGPAMTSDPAGLEAKTRDQGFVIAQLLEEEWIDAERVGALGWSFGGLASLRLGTEDARIRAIATLDGSIGTSEGLSVARATPGFDLKELEIPVLDIRAGTPDTPPHEAFEELGLADAFLARLPALAHEDFSSRLILAGRTSAEGRARDAERVDGSYALMCRLTLRFFDAYLREDRAALAALHALAEDSRRPPELGAIVVRRARSPRLTRREIVQLAHEGRSLDALARLGGAAQEHGAAALVDDEEIARLVVQRFGEGQLQEGTTLLEIMAAASPDEWRTLEVLALLRATHGEPDAALDSARRALALRPASLIARTIVEREGLLPRADDASLAAFEGRFAGALQSAHVAFERGLLWLHSPGKPSCPLLPLGERRFQMGAFPNAWLSFDEEPAPTTMTLHLSGNVRRLDRVD